MTRAIVIFGAAVWRDGRPSPSLRRRVGYGLAAARAEPDNPVFCTGGVGRHRPSEASLMAEMLASAGVPERRIVLDEESRDTLENVTAAASFVRGRSLDGVIACTDRYHQARAIMMFRLLGVDARPGPVAPGLGGTRLSYFLAMQTRELVAYPYDLAVVIRRRGELVRAIEAAAHKFGDT